MPFSIVDNSSLKVSQISPSLSPTLRTAGKAQKQQSADESRQSDPNHPSILKKNKRMITFAASEEQNNFIDQQEKDEGEETDALVTSIESGEGNLYNTRKKINIKVKRSDKELPTLSVNMATIDNKKEPIKP